jgi:hypothetical protein
MIIVYNTYITGRVNFMTENQAIAQEILSQMGGMKLLNLMVGANQFVAIESGVQFKFKMCRKFNTMVIKLDRGSDTYNVEFWKIHIRSGICVKVLEFEDIYFDQLQEIFVNNTGLDLTFPKVYRV